MAKYLSVAALIALVLGVGVGAWVAESGSAAAEGAARSVEGVGGLWLNALRMTVIPLIVSLLITGIASVSDAASTGRLAARAVSAFAVMLVVATLYAVVLMPVLLSLWPVDQTVAEAFVASAGDANIPDAPPFADWLASLAPSNLIAAAADGAILPLVVFAIVFGFAVTRLPDVQRAALNGFFQAVADAMIVIVKWVLLFAPIGVFALALGIGARAGLGATGVLVQYVVLVAGLTAGVTVIAALFGIVWGRTGPLKFLLAAAPVQALAMSTQSSLACLPAMVQRCRDVLGVSERTVDLVLPMAVTVFRITSTVANLGVAFFVAHVYGLEPSLLQILAACIVALAVSVGTVGLPGSASFFASIAPICLALGAPVDLLAILIAVEVIPDIFRTVGNVTADMAAAVIADRGASSEAADRDEQRG